MRLISVYLALRTHFSSRQRLVLLSTEDRLGGVLYIATYPPYYSSNLSISLRSIEPAIIANVPLISGTLPTSDRDAGDSSETLPPKTLEQRVERLWAERDVLRAEIKADKLAADVAAIRRLREAAAAPPQGDLPALDDDALSNKGRAAQPTPSLRAASDTVTPTHSSRLKLREPTPFKGDDIKAARDFIRNLEIVFALLGSAYSLDCEKVLYRVMFLAGDTYEQ